MAKNNLKGRKLKGYYKFQKKYPSKRGSVYEIGESRKRLKKERNMKIVIAVLLVCLFSVVYLILAVSNNLSLRPLSDKNENEESFATVESVSKMKAILVENKYISNMSDMDVILKNAKDAGFNAIMLDFKDRDGNLTYGSNLLKDVTNTNINPVTSNIIEKIQSEGFMVVARIFCFEDSLAPQRINSYVYSDWASGEIWFDNAPINDGRVWLNPARDASTDYICKVITEVKKLNVDCIFLESVEFPVPKGNSYPVFTGDDAGLNKNAVLTEFINKAVRTSGRVPLVLGMDLDCIEGGNKDKYGGTLSDTAAVICSPMIEPGDSDDYVSSIIGKNTDLNNKVKDNFTTIKVIPRAKLKEDDKEFIENLKNSSMESYIIVP